MGLFTNRKKDQAEDVAGLSEAASLLAQFNTTVDDEPEEMVTPVPPAPSSEATAPIPGFALVDPIGDISPVEEVDAAGAAPIADGDAPTRRLDDRPRAQAGNVEIDATGLLDMLGVDSSAALIDISEAHQRFLSDHEPVDGDTADALELKNKIRSEVNTAYASFRLTRAS